MDRQLMLFDVELHYRFHDASVNGRAFDMRTIFDGTLVAEVPDHAVTLVENHDTQPLQSLEAAVEPWFKPLAYALILMREQGVPSVFYPDLYGAEYRDKGSDGKEYDIQMPKIECLPKLIEARKRFANGGETIVFDDPNCLAIIRQGTDEAAGSVTVLTNGAETEKTLRLAKGMPMRPSAISSVTARMRSPRMMRGPHPSLLMRAASASGCVKTVFRPIEAA
nr:hypothetical protein [Marinicella sp. W31]MDC2875677.1 hypothetical protein [Marinicella sp. W31]